MSSYISSNNNRFYVQSEANYAQVATITDANRFPAVKLGVKQIAERAERKDKTGGRTFVGIPYGARKRTTFELQTYLTGWADQATQPGYGPLFVAAMGKAPEIHAGGAIAATPSATRVQFTAPHNMMAGQAVAFGGEIRFVSALVDSLTVELNAGFTIQPTAGSTLGATVTYRLGGELPSVSIFDHWDPPTAVQRIVSGVGIDKMVVKVNSDFHEFEFSGGAGDVLDSATFGDGQGGLTQFPVEPALSALGYEVIPGHLGQVWLGSTPNRTYTLTSAQVKLDNSLDLRSNEFGSDGPSCVSAGRRTVSLDMSLYEQDDNATKALYQAARQRSPISAMFQLGQQPGQLFGVYMKSVVPEVPEFDDKDSRLQWKFSSCRAQGVSDDELVIAFA